MKEKIIVSVIIPCFNAEKHIERCLDSILKSDFLDYEIIVVDDHSTDKTGKILKKYQQKAGVKIYYLKKNQGPAKARNIGVKKSLGKYLVFLDADTQVQASCLGAIANTFRKDKNIGAIQAKLLKGKSNKIDAAGHFLSLIGFPYEIGVGEDEKEHRQKKLIFGARSAGMGVKKEVFEKIGGFDEDYFIYGEETDLSWRIWRAGYKIYYLPKAVVHHFQKSSLNKKTKYRIFYEGAKNNLSNIIKNTPFKILLWLLPLHIAGWIFLSLRLVWKNKLKMAGWIYKGLGWNLKNAGRVLRKRKEGASYMTKNVRWTKIMFGNADYKTLLLKGWRWFKNV